MSKLETYMNLATPPPDALKPIEFGALKGKSDINPQWRYEALTKEFGVCGVGWKFEVVSHETVPVNSGEIMVFVLVHLYVKVNDEWSAPIPGYGGDYIIKKDKNGIHGNDEAFKMATTDALGTAAKMLGVAADVYRGKLNGASDSKYARREAEQAPQFDAVAYCKEIGAEARNAGITPNDLNEIVRFKYRKNSLACTKAELEALRKNYAKWFNEMLDARSEAEA